MSKKLFRIIALALAVCLCFGAAGCGNSKVVIEPMEIEDVYTVSYNFIGGKDVMPVSGFYAPFPTTLSHDGNDVTNTMVDKVFADLKEVGINHLSFTRMGDMLASTNAEAVEEYIRLAEKYGMGTSLYTANSNFSNVSIASETIKPFLDKHPSVETVYVTDEPSGPNYFADDGRELGNYFDNFKTLNALGYFGYCNLFPIYDAKQKKEYNEYLERYLSNCNPPMLLYDHYPFETNNFVTYFYNMSIISEKAQKYKIPWWCYIQAYTGELSKDEFLSEGQYHWLYNTYLAYGTKGINIYLAVQNELDISGIADADNKAEMATRIGLIGAYGNRTRYWYFQKGVAGQVQAIDHILMNSVHKGMLATGDTSKEYLSDTSHLLGDSWREIKNVKGDAIIGCFNYNGKSAFYVVNTSYEFAQYITLNLHDEYKLSVIQNAEESKVETNSLTLDMAAGEGVLIVVE